MTTPPLATSGAICSAAASTSHSLTQNMMTSQGAIEPGSSVAVALRDRRVAARALDAESALANRGQVRAARDER